MTLYSNIPLIFIFFYFFNGINIFLKYKILILFIFYLIQVFIHFRYLKKYKLDFHTENSKFLRKLKLKLKKGKPNLLNLKKKEKGFFIKYFLYYYHTYNLHQLYVFLLNSYFLNWYFIVCNNRFKRGMDVAEFKGENLYLWDQKQSLCDLLYFINSFFLFILVIASIILIIQKIRVQDDNRFFKISIFHLILNFFFIYTVYDVLGSNLHTVAVDNVCYYANCEIIVIVAPSIQLTYLYWCVIISKMMIKALKEWSDNTKTNWYLHKFIYNIYNFLYWILTILLFIWLFFIIINTIITIYLCL